MAEDASFVENGLTDGLQVSLHEMGDDIHVLAERGFFIRADGIALQRDDAMVAHILQGPERGFDMDTALTD